MTQGQLQSPPPRYGPTSEEQLIKAFEVLDKNHTSKVSTDALKKYLTEYGEQFTQEEMEDMLKAAEEKGAVEREGLERGVFFYRDYVKVLLSKQDQS